MICFSFELPKGHPRGPVVLVLVLDMENMERMKQADPFDFKLRRLPLPTLFARLRDVDLLIAYEDDFEALVRFTEKKDIVGLMQWLERGRKIRPGDLTLPVKVTGKERPS